jgi:hypothetical protein
VAQLFGIQMKKRLTAIIALILAALLAAPVFIGGRIESTTLQTLRAMVPGDAKRILTIRQTGFQRGWFSSRGKVEIAIAGLAELADIPATLVLDLDISHGPLLPAPDGLKLGLAYAVIEPELGGTQTAGPASGENIDPNALPITLFAAFDGAVELSVEVDNFQAGNEQLQLIVRDLRGTSRIGANQSADAALELDSLALSATDGSVDVAIQNMRFSGSEFDTAQAIATGQSSISIDRIISAAPLPVTMHSLVADYSLAHDPDASGYLKLSQQFGIEGMDWDLPVSALQWQFQLSNLNPELLANYLLLLQQSQQRAGTAPEQAAEQVTAIGQDLLLGLIGESLSFDNAFDIDAFAGNHSMQINIAWPGLPGVTDLQSLDLQEALQTVQIRLTLDADHAALMNSPFAQTVIDYERPGFLFIDNGRVRSTIQLANGVLNINGQLTPLEQFIKL